MQNPALEGHILVRRDHIEAVRLDPGAILDLNDLHGSGALEQLHHHALMRWVQVLDNDKDHPALGRNVPQEQLQSLEPPGGCADADDGEIEMGLLLLRAA